MATKISFVSLGCDKNLIDSEIMLGLIDEKGYIITSYAPYINQFYYVSGHDIIRLKSEKGQNHFILTNNLIEQFEA